MIALLYDWLTPQGVIAIGVVAGFVQGFMNRRNIKKIELATNSIVEARVTAERAASHAEGRAEGVEAEARKRDIP